MTTVAVLGAGSWGTTLANLLAHKGYEIRLWAYESEVVDAVNDQHENTAFLPGCPLAESIRASGDAHEVVAGAEVVLSAIPSHAVRSVVMPLGGHVVPDALVVSVTKGIETDTLEFMHTVLAECLPGRPIAVLSGPSFAREVYEGQPTAVVAASEQLNDAERAQDTFATSRFRIYTITDVIGAELGGSLKNVIAIAAGILEGLGMGHNPRAALITRGLAEITRLGEALGADPHTFAGLAGMGDLVLTAFGPQSRNHSLGVALGRGESLKEYVARHRTVAEGVNSARAAVRLAERVGVELPISTKVAEILFEGKPPRETVAELMGRDLKAERWA
jgi:glycerol-3-phosphate dehydrogenase (NAD(P)+)